MLVPLSWLKEYVDITLTPEKLGEKLTEVGLGTEKIEKTKDDTIFDLEITPNRPDLLSIIGIAREIAAIENTKIKIPQLRQGFAGQAKIKKVLPLTIRTDSKINPRFTGIIINGIEVKESPNWLKERLKKIGQRPINNIVDITNYVMFEFGNPIHAFDYKKIKGSLMKVHRAKGGEKFTSVDGLIYHLPKGAVVISDSEKIIDLCGIKGGLDSGTYNETETIFIRVPVEIPVLIRKTATSLSLRSEASSIFERGVNAGGTVDALKRCVELVLDIAGGQIASELFDIRKEDFLSRKLNLELDRLNKILGIAIPEKEVLNLLQRLNLNPLKKTKNIIETTVPTYRNDLKIEEDLIEEVARLYGYNKFPKTIPAGQIPTKQLPYFKNYEMEKMIKNIFSACGFSEISTYSLISEKDLLENNIVPDKTLRVDNPVSREFEYLRPSLIINLKKALLQNKPYFEQINLFELGKVYVGSNIGSAQEFYFLCGISNNKNFYEIKGIIEKIFEDFGVNEGGAKYIQIFDEGIYFELNFSDILSKINLSKKYKPIPKYPPIIEDLAIEVSEKITVGDTIEEIKKQSPLITQVSLLDVFENSKTFHIVYQHRERNLTNEEVSKIREKILEALKKKFKIRLKE